MMPSDELISLLQAYRVGSDPIGAAADDVLTALREVDAARWSIPSLPGYTIGALFKKYWVSKQSRLLHFQIAPSFVATLDLISHQLAIESGEFPLGGL